MKPFVILFLLAASALASPEPEKRATRELTRDPASDVEGEYRDREDGLPRGVIHLGKIVGESRGRVEVTIDHKAGTILLKRAEPPEWLTEWEHITPEAEGSVDEKATSPHMHLNEPPHPDECPCEGQECSGSINAWGYLRDNPAWSNLAKTSVIGGWQRKVNNMQRCVWVGLPSAGGCVAAHPTSMGTNWYRTFFDPCTVTPATVTSGIGGVPGNWEKSARGSYTNDDFGNPFLDTDAWAIIFPKYHSGSGTDLYFDADAQGEGRERIALYIDWTMITSCAQ